MAEGVYIYRFIWAGACLSAGMNIDCEIGIRGDSCQRGGLIWGPQALPACLSLRHRSVAALHGSHSLLSASVSAREACLPLCVLIFLLEWLLFSPSSHSATCTRSLPLFHSSSVCLSRFLSLSQISPFLSLALHLCPPFPVSLSPNISPSPLSLSLYLSLPFCLSKCINLSSSLHLSPPFCLSPSLYIYLPFLSFFLSVYISLPLSLSLSFTLYISFSPHLSFSYSSFI